MGESTVDKKWRFIIKLTQPTRHNASIPFNYRERVFCDISGTLIKQETFICDLDNGALNVMRSRLPAEIQTPKDHPRKTVSLYIRRIFLPASEFTEVAVIGWELIDGQSDVVADARTASTIGWDGDV